MCLLRGNKLKPLKIRLSEKALKIYQRFEQSLFYSLNSTRLKNKKKDFNCFSIVCAAKWIVDNKIIERR